MGCLAIVLSIPLVSGIIHGFSTGNAGLVIGLIAALLVLWWIAGALHNRAQVAQGFRGEVGTRALYRLPEWREAIQQRNYQRALSESRVMISHARQSRRFEGDQATLGMLLNLHIGTLHLAREHSENDKAIQEFMGTLQPGQEHHVRLNFERMFRSDDETLAVGLLQASHQLFPHV